MKKILLTAIAIFALGIPGTKATNLTVVTAEAVPSIQKEVEAYIQQTTLEKHQFRLPQIPPSTNVVARQIALPISAPALHDSQCANIHPA